MSEDARDLCRKLLEKDPSKRLGSPSMGGIRALQEHPFFEGLDWQDLYHKRLVPPYKPQLDHCTDTRHFLKEFTQMNMSPQEKLSLKESLSPSAAEAPVH